MEHLKNKYWLMSIIILLLVCSYLFYRFYRSELDRKIVEVHSYQKVQAKLAAKGLNELFEKWNTELSFLSKDERIVSLSKYGREQLINIQNDLRNEISSITRVDKNGKILFITPSFKNSVGRNISNQKHITKILSDHKPIVSDVFFAVQGFQAIAFHYPVYLNGKFDGTIAFVINFVLISQKILDDIKLGETGSTWMLSSEGTELYCINKSHIGKSIFENAKNDWAILNIAKKMIAGREGSARYSAKEYGASSKTVNKIAYYNPIKLINTYWSIAVTTSEEEIAGSLSAFVRKLIYVFAFIYLTGIVFVYLGSKAWIIIKERDARIKAEIELKESEERYRFISNTVSDYMFSSKVDENGKLKLSWVGGAFESITEYSLEEYIANGGWRGALYPEDRLKDEEDLKNLLNNKNVVTEVRTISKSGKIVWVRVYAHPVWDSKTGKLTEIYGAVQNITENKLAEDSLKMSEEKFSKAFFSSPDSITLTKLSSGQLIEVNEGFEKLFGYTREEAIGKTSLELRLYEQDSTREYIYEQVKSEGRVKEYEARGRRKSGELRECLLSMEVISFMGEPYSLTTVRDITERKIIEERAKRFSKIFEYTLTEIYIIDAKDFSFVELNQAAKKNLGYSNEELRAKTLLDFRPDLTLDTLLKLTAPLVDGSKEKIVFFTEHIRKDGSKYPVEVHLQYTTFESIPTFVAYTLDITERKKTEEILKLSEEKFHTIFRLVPEGLSLTSLKDGRMIDVNNAMCKVSGYSREELIGQTTTQMNFWKNPEDRNRFLAELIVAGTIYNFEADLILKSGQILSCLISGEIVGFQNEKFILSSIVDITDRIRIQRALKESEERLTQAVRAASIGIFVKDVSANTYYWSPQLRVIHGFGEFEELNELDFLECVYPPDLENLTKGILKAQNSAGDGFYEFEHRIIHRNGGIRWLSSKHQTYFEGEGADRHIVRTVGAVIDITERKIAEDILKRSEENYRQLYDSMIDSYSVASLDGKITKWNKSFEKMIGYSGVEIPNLRNQDLSPVKWRFTEEKIIQEQVLQQGYSDVYEKEYYHKNGTVFPVELRTFLIQDSHGKPTGMWSIIRDITERKIFEDRLKTFQRVTEQSPASIVITDMEGQIEYVNDRFCKTSGYSQEEIIGKPLRILNFTKNDNLEFDTLWNTIIVGHEWKGEYYNKKKDGSRYWESTLISPIKESDGKITHLIVVQEDITDRKDFEMKLLQAKEHAEQMNRLKSNFLANMSHELRTPLVGMMGFSELLMEELEGDTKELVNLMNLSSQRLLHTLNIILNYSEIEADKLKIFYTNVSAVDVIRNAIKIYEPLANQGNIKLIEDFRCEEIFIDCDEAILKDIVGHLMNNALRFTKEGSITVILETHERDFIIEIKDTGIGIPDNMLEIIFDEFRQVSEGYGRNFEGTGLGLTIVKKYAAALGGSVKVKSELGKGSTFTVILPITNKEVNFRSGEILTNRMITNSTENETKGREYKILLVEDDPINSLAINSMLNKKYLVEIVSDADEAITQSCQVQYDIILMDINLKCRMSGSEAMVEIRKNDFYKNTPIIAMTAYAMKSDEKDFLSSGFSHYISKPFTGVEILKLLERVISEIS